MSDEAISAPDSAGSVPVGGESSERVETVLAVVTDGDRRSTMVALRESGPLSLPDLAARVAAGERPPEAVGDAERRRTAIALHHNHLPRLADAGLVAIERRDGQPLVRRVDGLAEGVLEAVDDLAGREDRDAVVALLADPDRRRVVRALRSAGGAIPLDDLAARIAESDGADREGAAIDSARVALHHVHLPRLEAAGVVDYDPDERRVAPGENAETLVDGPAGS